MKFENRKRFFPSLSSCSVLLSNWDVQKMLQCKRNFELFPVHCYPNNCCNNYDSSLTKRKNVHMFYTRILRKMFLVFGLLPWTQWLIEILSLCASNSWLSSVPSIPQETHGVSDVKLSIFGFIADIDMEAHSSSVEMAFDAPYYPSVQRR